jgi:hypothetical protein
MPDEPGGTGPAAPQDAAPEPAPQPETAAVTEPAAAEPGAAVEPGAAAAEPVTAAPAAAERETTAATETAAERETTAAPAAAETVTAAPAAAKPELAAAEPAAGEPTAITAPADAEAAAAGTQASQVDAAAATAAKGTRRRRVLGFTGQAVGVIGVVVSLALVVAVLLGRGWAVDRTDEAANTVNGALAQGVTLIDTASGRVSEVSGRLGAVVDASSALATNPNPAPGLSAALTAQLQPIQDKYIALRSAYTNVKTTVVSAFDRLQTLDRLLPFISIPQGPVDTLTALDAKFQDIDAKVSDLFTTPGSGAVNAIAAGIATRATNLQSSLENVTTTLDDVSARVTTLQSNVQTKADQVKLMTTLAAIVLMLLFVYLAFLHVVLFRASSRYRRGVHG